MSATRSRVLAGALGAALLAAYFPVFVYAPQQTEPNGPVEGFFFQPSNTSPALIYGLIALFLWGRRQRILAAMAGAAAPGSGGLLLAFGAAVFGWSLHTASIDLQTLSLIPVALGGALWLAGPGLARAILLPTIMLIFAVPIPGALVNQVIFPLQQLTADWTVVWLQVLGVPVTQSGDILLARDRTFMVIETCSGLRGIETLAMASVVYLEVFHRRRWRAAALVLAAPLIAFFMNSIRVLLIVLMPLESVGQDHSVQGIGTLVFGVLLLHGLDLALGRILPPGADARLDPVPPSGAAADGGWARRAPVLLGLLAAMIAALFAVRPWPQDVSGQTFNLVLPVEWDGYRSRRYTLDPDFLGTLQFSRRFARAYEGDGRRVELFVGFDDLLKREQNPISPKLGVPGPGFEILERWPIELEGVAGSAEAMVLRSGAFRVLSYSWYEGAKPRWIELARAVAGVDRSALRSDRGIAAVRVSIGFGDAVAARTEADRILREFAKKLRPLVLEAMERSSI